MAADVQTGEEPTMTGLVSGILADAQQLISQQLTLFRHELEKDVREAKEVVPSLAIGLGGLLIAGVLFGFTLVYLLALVPGLPLWACYGIVAAAAAAVGGAFLFFALQKMQEGPLSTRAVEATKENVEWLTKPK
jgi:pilus assembly protein TadC